MVTGPELLRQLHVETYGDADPHATAALELRKLWLSVHSELDPGGTLWVEREGVTDLANGAVMLAWRPLDVNDAEDDWELVKACLNDPARDFLPERYDWLMVALSGDRLVVIPHALKLLTPYEVPENIR